jgi:hypothetical protein
MATEYTKLGTEQVTTGPDGQKQEISIEVADGRAELVTLVHYPDGEDRLTTVKLTRTELWEHVHNCVDALTRLPEQVKA